MIRLHVRSAVMTLGCAAVLAACSGANENTETPPAPTEPSAPPPVMPVEPLAPPAEATPAQADKPADAQPVAAAKEATPSAAPEAAKVDAAPVDIRYTSSPAESLINDGVNLMRDHNLFDARQRLQAATTQDPKSATAWYNLALAQYRIGNPDDAIQSAAKAVELNPTYSRAAVLLSVLHLRKGDTKQALDVLDQALQRRPADVMLLGAKTRALVEDKEYQRALEVGIRAIKLDQDNPEALRYLGEAYLGLGREGLARLALDRAFQIYTGTIETSAGAQADATAVGRKSYEVRIARGGGSLRGSGSEAIDRDAGMAHIYYLFGQIAMKRNDVVEAREDFLQATKLRPDYAEAWNNLGVCWIVAKKGEESIDCLTRALEIQPTNFEARLNLGSAYRISKDPQRAEKAKAEYERAQKQEPRNPAPVFNLGILYLESQLPDTPTGDARFQKALDYFSQYRELRGSTVQRGQKDPLDDYVAEAKNLLKIEQDKRKVQDKAAAEKAEEAKKKIEDDAKKAEEDGKKAEAAAKKAEEDAAKKAEEDRKAAESPAPETPKAPDAPPPVDAQPPPAAEKKPDEAPPPPPPADAKTEVPAAPQPEAPPPPPPPVEKKDDKPEEAPPPPPPPAA